MCRYCAYCATVDWIIKELLVQCTVLTNNTTASVSKYKAFLEQKPQMEPGIHGALYVFKFENNILKIQKIWKQFYMYTTMYSTNMRNLSLSTTEGCFGGSWGGQNYQVYQCKNPGVWRRRQWRTVRLRRKCGNKAEKVSQKMFPVSGGFVSLLK
jgi:hypothetical protein